METKAIETFLQEAYTDEKLAALLAHCEDGKLSYVSCCCLVGSSTANHALRGLEVSTTEVAPAHLSQARRQSCGFAAEREFFALGFDKPVTMGHEPMTPAAMTETLAADIKRRERLKPLILAEMDRRERQRQLDFEIKLNPHSHSTDTENSMQLWAR